MKSGKKTSKSHKKTAGRIFILQKDNPSSWWEFSVLIAAIFIIYLPGLKGEMLFDDIRNIRENPYLQNVSDLQWLFKIPEYSGLTGRPFLQWSFALNILLLGKSLFSYHIVNTLLHILNSIFIYLISATILKKKKPSQNNHYLYEKIPFVVALIWAVNPIHTHAVTYIIQRAEVQMAFGFLGAVYFAIADMSSGKQIRYSVISILFAFLSMGTKEVGTVIPVVVFMLHRTYGEGGLLHILKKRWVLYLGYFLALCITLILTIRSSVWNDSASSALSGFEYFKTQTLIFFYYIKTFLLPGNHAFDLTWETVPGNFAFIILSFIIFSLIISSVILFVKRKWYAWQILSIFLILAPTSSFIPLPDPVYIHRFYLPGIFITAFIVVGMLASFNYLISKNKMIKNNVRTILTGLLIAVCFYYGNMTIKRNKLHQSAKLVWQDTLEKDPNNARAYNNLGRIYLDKGNPDKALENLNKALTFNTRSNFTPVIKYNLGNCYFDLQSYDQALINFSEAIRLKEDYWSAYINRGVTFIALNRFEEAARDQRLALKYVKTNPYLYMQYAFSLYKLNYTNEAKDVIKTAESRGIAIPNDFK
ncbi:MAG: tetratricopeptide repeat protein, partial [Bacteroidales bacterium]